MKTYSSPFKVLVLCAVLFLSGCDGGPTGPFPGGELSGTVVTERISDWSAEATGSKSRGGLTLETNGDVLRSVNMNYELVNGKIYIEGQDGRTWCDELKKNLSVRIRFDERIYPVRAVLVTDPAELSTLLETGQYIYRFESIIP